MQKKSLFKRALSGVLAVTMVLSTLISSQSSIIVSANGVSTTVTDSTISGTGSVESIKGNWSTLLESPCVYRLSVVRVANPDTLTGDTVISQSQHYEFRDIALYEVGGSNTAKALGAYAFTSATTRTANTIEHLTLGSDSTYSFAEAGINLSLPTQVFSATNYQILPINNELTSKIRTEDSVLGEANVREIFAAYIAEVGRRYANLSTNGQIKYNTLVAQSGYGTSNWESWSKNFGLCIEICSVGTNLGGQSFIFSYGDMLYTGIGNDVHYIYKPLNESNEAGTLLSWSAKYNTLNYNVTGEYNGQAVFLLYNTGATSSKEVRSQAVNVAISVDSELRADIDTSDVSKNFGVVTSDANPDVTLGDEAYVSVMDNSYANTLADTEITLYDGNTVLKTQDKSNALELLSSKGDYDSKSILLGYQTLSIPIDSDNYNLEGLSSVKLEKALKKLTATTKVNAVSGGFGNKYSLNFSVNDKTVRSSVADAISKIDGVSSVGEKVSLEEIGTVDNMSDLQSATLLSSKIEGTSTEEGYVDVDGTIHASISYLAKDKKVKSKEAETYINKDAEVESVKAIDTKKYSVTDSVEWGMTGKDKSYTYVIAWRASDYDLTDEKALTESILTALGGTYVLRGDAGKSTLSKGFKAATGVQPIGVKYLTDQTLIEVGSIAKDDNSLTGINILIVNVSEELPVSVESEDLLDSDELNFVYPNLLGMKATTDEIVPIASSSRKVKYPYKVTDTNAGDLIDFKGSNAHYYYETTGLFGVFTSAEKSFKATAYPSYAYNIARTLWNDDIVVSNYRGISATDEAVKNDLINNLGFRTGTVGNLSEVTCGENIDGTVSTTKKDVYKFTADIGLKSGGKVKEVNKYSITHSLNKYTCLNLDTALNEKAGGAGFSIQTNSRINNKVTMVTQSDNVVTVYPEVSYKYYMSESTDGVLNNVKPLSVYVMGEKARTMKPSSIRGIDIDYSGALVEVATGDVISDGALVGSSASAMSSGLQVIPQGTNITMKADHTTDYRLISYSLDVIDSYGGVNVRNEFSSENVNYKPADEHETFVKNFIDNVKVDTYMHIGNKEYEMATNSTKPTLKKATETTHISILFADGVIDEHSKNAIINDMASEYGILEEQAKEMFESSGLEKQLQEMFESSTDSSNASTDKWYDEESAIICIRKYVTVVNLNDLLVQDKVSYGTVGALGYEASGQTAHTSANAYFSLSVTLPEEFNGCNLINANKLIHKQKIKDTDFKVSSSTTSDFDSGYGND